MSAFGPQDPMRQQQEMMRKQQEQMRKQQEDLRRRQQMGAWAEQKKAQERNASAASDPFTRVEKEAAWLRQERAAGRLTEEDLKARLKELMFQDASGAWWMVGQQSGEWYRNEGGQWVRASPAVSTGAAHSTAPFVPRGGAERRGHRSFGCLVLLLGLGITFWMGFGPEPLREMAGNRWDLPCAGVVWLLGTVVTLIVASKIRRG